MADSPLPPYAIIVNSEVADFDAWKKVFDGNEDMRRGAGIVAHHVNRAEDDGNRLLVFFAASDLGQAQEFMTSPAIREVMSEAGVQGPPDVGYVVPKRQEVIWEGELPALVAAHAVRDFDTWVKAYDDTDDLRRANGIVGHAANHAADDPTQVTVYHQAESFDALRAFVELPELRTAMESGGVAGPPEFTYWTGGWGKRYE